MAAFFDIRELASVPKERKLRLAGWLAAVTLLSLLLFFLRYLNLEYPAYVIATLASLVLFAAELACVFRSSDCRITPLFLFLAAFYLTRNSQFLMVLLGVQFDVHHLVLLQPHLKDAVVLTAVGNIWAGLAGVIVAVPKAQMCRNPDAAEEEADAPAPSRVLAWGGLVTGLAAYGALIAPAAGASSAAWGMRLLSFLGWLFLPFGFALTVRCAGTLCGAASAGALAVYFLLSVFLGDPAAGIAGLFVLTVFFCCLWNRPGRRAHNAAILGTVLLLVAVLSGLAAYLRNPSAFAGKTFGAILAGWVSDLGRGCFALLALISIVPGSESAVWGREYASSLLSSLLPVELDPTGTLTKLTPDAELLRGWNERYLQNAGGEIGFSADAEGYLNFLWLGFLAVFLLCLGVSFLLDRYRFYGSNSAFPKYTACVMLWSALTLPGNDSAHLIRMFLWGVLLMRVIWQGRKPDNKPPRSQRGRPDIS